MKTRRLHRVHWYMVALTVFSMALFTFAILFRVEGCVISSPGQVSQAARALEIEGQPTYDASGEVNLVTVRTIYGPSIMRLVFGWLDSSVEVRSAQQFLGGQTREDRIALGRLQMSQSEELAVAVALDKLGYDALEPQGALVQAVSAGSPAEGVLERGDVIVTIDDELALSATRLAQLVRSYEPHTTVELRVFPNDLDDVDEGSSFRTLSVTLGEEDGRALLGVSVLTFVDIATDLDVDVSLDNRNIGGPSAGLAMTLAVLEALTPGDIAGDLTVVATGAITAEGWVLPVGGIKHKAHSALRAGADIMFVPFGQAAEAESVVGDYLELIEVLDVDEALAALAARGGDLSDLSEPPV